MPYAQKRQGHFIASSPDGTLVLLQARYEKATLIYFANTGECFYELQVYKMSSLDRLADKDFPFFTNLVA